MTKRSIDADAAQKREERMQQRIEQAYTEIPAFLSDCLHHVEMCMYHWADDLDSEVPPLRRFEPTRRAAAQLHSSRLVRDDWAGFDSKMVAFSGYVSLYRSNKSEAVAGWKGAIEPKQAARTGMEHTASDLRNMADQLFDQMHKELSPAAPESLPSSAAELP